jgi:SAM-dependent methyltransferase
MNPDPFIAPFCVICGGRTFTVLCPAREVATQLRYLQHFHRRRLRTASQEAFADRATFTQDYVTDIVACTQCGLVLRTPHPPTHAITAAYQSDHYGDARLATLFAAQLRSYRSKARALQHRLPRNGNARIFEIGSFVGGFLAAGQEYGWEMLGVDPGKEVSAFCREKGLPVFCGTLSELPVTANSIDAVAIWNTFDQLPDPVTTISTVCHILRPGGILVIRVPNGECFRWAVTRVRTLPRPLSRWLQAMLAWNNLLAFPYLYGYSVPTLDRLLRGYGFTRIAAQSDTLMPLADRHTKAWAVMEERLLKYLCVLAARFEQVQPVNPLQVVPWLDVYYQLAPHETIAESLVDTPQSVTLPQWQSA